MRALRSVVATVALAALVVLSSGCTVSIVDPSDRSSDAASTPERSDSAPDPTGAPLTPTSSPRPPARPSATPTSPALSIEGAAERARLGDAATTTTACPQGPLTEDGAIIRIEGPCPELVIEIDAGAVIADEVDALTLSGSGTIVYVTGVGTVTITGSANAVHWQGDAPAVVDRGAANVVQRG